MGLYILFICCLLFKSSLNQCVKTPILDWPLSLPYCTSDRSTGWGVAKYPLIDHISSICESEGIRNAQLTNEDVKDRLISYGVSDTFFFSFFIKPEASEIRVFNIVIGIFWNYVYLQVVYPDCETTLNNAAFPTTLAQNLVVISSDSTAIRFWLNGVEVITLNLGIRLKYNCSSPYNGISFLIDNTQNMANFTLFNREFNPEEDFPKLYLQDTDGVQILTDIFYCYGVPCNDTDNVCNGRGRCVSQNNCEWWNCYRFSR